MNQEVDRAIEESILEDRIVHLASAPEITAALVMACEDYACLDGEVTEFWGTDECGNAWRVHTQRNATKKEE